SSAMAALEEIAGSAIDQQDVGLGALGLEVHDTGIRGEAELEERVVEPELILERNKRPPALAVDGGRFRVERVEPEIAVFGAIVECVDTQDMFRRDVVLEAQEIVARPLRPRVGAGRLFLYHGKRVLQAHRVGEPEAAAFYWSRNGQAWIPVAQMGSILDVDAR